MSDKITSFPRIWCTILNLPPLVPIPAIFLAPIILLFFFIKSYFLFFCIPYLMLIPIWSWIFYPAQHENCIHFYWPTDLSPANINITSEFGVHHMMGKKQYISQSAVTLSTELDPAWAQSLRYLEQKLERTINVHPAGTGVEKSPGTPIVPHHCYDPKARLGLLSSEAHQLRTPAWQIEDPATILHQSQLHGPCYNLSKTFF